MILFSFDQILGLLLFFTGLQILNRCGALERKERLKEKICETMQSIRPIWQGRETVEKPTRRVTLFGLWGTFVSLLGMILFLVY